MNGWALTCGVLRGLAVPFPLFMMLDWLCLRGSFKVMAGLIVLPGVPFALACCNHSYFVGSCTSVLTLKLDPLGAGFVIDTPPLLGAPSAPVLGPVTSSNPVRQHWQWEALSSTHQLFQRVYAGTLAIWNIFGGSQFPAANLDTTCQRHRILTSGFKF